MRAVAVGTRINGTTIAKTKSNLNEDGNQNRSRRRIFLVSTPLGTGLSEAPCRDVTRDPLLIFRDQGMRKCVAFASRHYIRTDKGFIAAISECSPERSVILWRG